MTSHYSCLGNLTFMLLNNYYQDIIYIKYLDSSRVFIGKGFEVSFVGGSNTNHAFCRVLPRFQGGIYVLHAEDLLRGKILGVVA